MRATRQLIQPDDACFHFSPEGGMVEMLVELGADVAKGMVLARIWPTGHTGREALEVVANRDGVLVARHFPGLVQTGDCLAVLAVDVDSA